MKVAIMIMSTEKQPSVRNIEAMKETMVWQTNDERFKHDYTFFEYTYVDSDKPEDTVADFFADKAYPNYFYIKISGKESVYHTFEKTYVAFDFLLNDPKVSDKFDMFVRINISCYLNMRLLDAVIGQMNPHTVYANALNTLVNIEGPFPNALYARGDFYIISRHILEGVMQHAAPLMHCDQDLGSNRLAVTHVDDTLFGYAFVKFFGKNEYHKHLQMIKYNFLPMTSDERDYEFLKSEFGFNAISTRVKTTPPGMVSGYSWDDNEWRKHDSEKMKIVHRLLAESDYDYSKTTMDDILVSPLEERDALFVQAVNLKPHQIIAAMR